MAGHSHWSKVKRAKGASDVKRGALFSKLAKEITVATRLSGGDPNFNPRLRTAIAAARAESMPVDNIDRAIQKGTGELAGGGSIEEITYEGYGPGGVALMVETQTDNKNRTAAEIRHLFTKHGGNLGGSNSVAWMFRRRGVFLLENAHPDVALEATLEAGADDVRPAGHNATEVVCPPDRFNAVDKALRTQNLPPAASRLIYEPENPASEPDPETSAKISALIEDLEEHGDVQSVWPSCGLCSDPGLRAAG
ncbi:MAG: YebC/PmpR family DNA-binding transcriptional regulator [Verrucomicrobia bacterium]|nr:YebC/PmpR family DNA-binding transcriptional regulator [Verrucomicrobiota bacterium]